MIFKNISKGENVKHQMAAIIPRLFPNYLNAKPTDLSQNIPIPIQ